MAKSKKKKKTYARGVYLYYKNKKNELEYGGKVSRGKKDLHKKKSDYAKGVYKSIKSIKKRYWFD